MYKKREHIHFVGVGGIGMSGIAEIVRLQGYPVSGCDGAAQSSKLNHLKGLGCTIYHGHCKDHVNDADVLVYSSAIDQDNEEIAAAKTKGVPVISRALMLAELMRTKFSIAVSGSHGKTTTTSMISHILIEARLNPTVIVGGVLKNIASNAQLGQSDLLIAEADESDRSLLYLNPTMAVVTNVDAEHLDMYADLDDVKSTFKNFLERLPFYGKAFLCADDQPLVSLLPLPHICVTKYGFSDDADLQGEVVELGDTVSVFDVYSYKVDTTGQRQRTLIGRMKLNMPGVHNVQNALAAIAVARECDVSFEVIAQALATFGGVERRFELKGICKGAELFDDYGHHPTEIKHTLTVARKRARKKLYVAFQPHRFTRTQKLWQEFVDVFCAQQDYVIDRLFIADIYPASEKPIAEITSFNLARAMAEQNPLLDVIYCASYEQVKDRALDILQEGDLFVTVGAGKINCVLAMLAEYEQEGTPQSLDLSRKSQSERL
ncbi:MAG: UDP-N-acetylmuramate--L-alanine ligase [Epsilonproteobacteria bacterium]|nr:UDP-N-acetylmuramate--L-alanine ligase [Campylobacterota bacterium]